MNIRTDYHFAYTLERAFAERQIYLYPLLNINALARELGTNRTYISRYLNSSLHTTFYDYVNDWRIRHARHLLTATDLSVEQIAEQSGFNSLSSFRRYFLRIVGTTPLKYRKRFSSEQS